MKRTLHIAIESGETTCASSPGKFCPFMRTTRMGTKWICGLFNGAELHGENGDPYGWLQRLDECKDAEKQRGTVKT